MNFFERLQDVFGFSDPYNQYDSFYDDRPNSLPPPARPEPYQTPIAAPLPVAPPATSTPRPFSPSRKIVEMPGLGGKPVEFMLMEPRSFEEIPIAISALRERKAVILNLTLMDPDQAQRSVDYLAGGTFAIDGDQERLGESIFLFTPSFVQISRHESPGMTPLPLVPQPDQLATSSPLVEAPSAPSDPW